MKSYFSLKQYYITAPTAAIIKTGISYQFHSYLYTIYRYSLLQASFPCPNLSVSFQPYIYIILINGTINLSMWKVDVNQPQTERKIHSNLCIHTPGWDWKHATCFSSHRLWALVMYNSLITAPNNECYSTDL